MNIVRAPDFPIGATWINTDEPLQFRTNLRGQVVLLDFWTYCCVNCMHVLPELAAIEERFKNDPVVVIGVHSAKFTAEEDPAAIRMAMQRYGVRHPVVVDAGRRLWDEYAVRGWPTLVLVGADGRIAGAVSGEGNQKLLEHAIVQALEEARAAGKLAEGPLKLRAEETTSASPLRFPGKVVADGARGRLFVVDSNRHRVVITDWPDNSGAVNVLEIIGSGEQGRRDGGFAETQFHRPQGACLSASGNVLWVADTENHLVRRVDLEKKTVVTVLGTGAQEFDPEAGKTGTKQALNSPWDVAVAGNRLYIAQAGQHQIWAMNGMSAMAEVAAGTGREAIWDGPALETALAQPSALAMDAAGERLYFADAETSSIRYLDMKTRTVHTLVGRGLFVFGDLDGDGETARLQHPLGVALAADGATLYVADTYNHKLKTIDLQSGQVRTLAVIDGEGRPFDFAEPAGLSATPTHLFVADTNHHRVVEVELATLRARELQIRGLA
jgi:sugar lactone lactonase YvrE/thiol-disulfide isomerase/thioredoxin